MLVEMTKVHVIGHRRDLDAVVAALHELQAMQLVDVTDDRDVHLPPLAVDDARLAEIREARALRSRLDAMVALAPPVDGSTGAAPPVDPETARRELERDGPEIERLVREIDDLSAEQETLPRHVEALGRLLPLLPDAATTGGYDTAAVLIDRRFANVLASLDAELGELLEANHEIISERIDADTIGAVVVFPRRAAAEVQSLLGREQLSQVRLPARFSGMPFREALRAMDRRLAELPEALESRRSEIAAIVGRHPDWPIASRQLADRIDQLDAVRMIGATPHTFVICGWVPVPRLPDVRATLDRTTDATTVLIETPPEPDDSPPVLLDNPRVARPFEVFVRLLSVPEYGGFDPTVLMLAFMPLFIGIMLGDIVYGAALLATAVAVGRRFADRPGPVLDISRVLAMSAAWSIVWGVIYGELLGDLGHRWFGLEPIWVNREEALEPLLVFSLGVGAAHVVLGVLLGIWRARRRARHSLFAERVGLLAALTGTFVIVGVVVDRLPAGLVTPGVAALIVGLAVMIASGGAMGLLMGPLELVGALGNVLSYLRIAAIGLASVYLARVANELGATAPLWLGIVVAALFHALNLALGAFSPTIQALRLHYVEFFGKFYEEGGVEYRPFGPTDAGAPRSAGVRTDRPPDRRPGRGVDEAIVLAHDDRR